MESAATDKIWVTGIRREDEHLLHDLQRVLGNKALSQLGIFQVPADFKLSVAMPVHNEIRTLDAILERVRAVPVPKEILVVDDGSTDGSRERLREWEQRNLPELRIFFHERNQGKGAALKTAFKAATGDVVIIQDADLEYDPAEYPKLIQPIVDGRADVVYGSRFRGEVTRVHLFHHRVANAALTFLSNMFTGLNLTDMETCYKVFRRELLDGIEITQRGFGVEPELTAKLARKRCRVYEMPISYSGRSYEEGKHISPWKDGPKALYCIIRYAFFD